MAAHPRDSKSGELRRGPDSEGFGGPPDRVDRLAAHAKLLQPVLKRAVGDRPAAAFDVVEFVLRSATRSIPRRDLRQSRRSLTRAPACANCSACSGNTTATTTPTCSAFPATTSSATTPSISPNSPARQPTRPAASLPTSFAAVFPTCFSSASSSPRSQTTSSPTSRPADRHEQRPTIAAKRTRRHGGHNAWPVVELGEGQPVGRIERQWAGWRIHRESPSGMLDRDQQDAPCVLRRGEPYRDRTDFGAHSGPLFNLKAP